MPLLSARRSLLVALLSAPLVLTVQAQAQRKLDFMGGPERIPASEPLVELVCAGPCVVTIDMVIARDGTVTERRVDEKNTSCTDASLPAQVLELAKGYTFGAAPNAPEQQKVRFICHITDTRYSTETIVMMDDMPVPEPKVASEILDISSAEVRPEFPGGQEAWYRYLSKTLRYPADAADAGIQGKVFMEFVVQADGRITNVLVKRGVHPSLDKEALRVVKSMPNWNPGQQNGRAVPVRLVEQIAFTLR